MEFTLSQLITIAILVAGWITGGALYVWIEYRKENKNGR